MSRYWLAARRPLSVTCRHYSCCRCRYYSFSPTLPLPMSKKQVTLARFFAKREPKDEEKQSSSPVKEQVQIQGQPQQEQVKIQPQEQKQIVVPQEVTTSTQTPRPTKKSKPATSSLPYADLCQLFETIESESSRLTITNLCTAFFSRTLQLDPSLLVPVTYLCINKLGPDYSGVELGLGEGLLLKAIGSACGVSQQQLKLQYRKLGDLGQLAMSTRVLQPTITMFKLEPLTITKVFDTLAKIAASQGKDSQNQKINMIKRLLTSCQGVEAKFLIRSLESKLRIGLAEKTVLTSLARALVIHEKGNDNIQDDDYSNAEQIIKDSFCQIPNYEIIITTSLQYGVSQLASHIKLTPGIPLKPMLAKPTKSISEVLDTFQNIQFTSEYKYDGERAQVHLLPDGSMRIYSRNGEDMTQRYPELNIQDYLVDSTTTTQLILDCEAVAWDVELQKILPFQVLSTRKRKSVDLKDIKVRVCLFAFDILRHNNDSLINNTLRERRDILHSITKPCPGQFQFATELTTSNLDELQTFLDKAIKDSCEGLMVKSLDGTDSHYEPSKRSRNWLKLKKDYLQGMGDSLDLCVLGAYYGRGKRTGTYGGFLLACYNQDTEEFETCCKIGTGFSDEMLQTLYNGLKETAIESPRANFVFDSSAEPDVWFNPTMVFEVLTADLSLSPIYKAGSTVYGKGISLRFPRFIRIRTDKSVNDATSSEQVIDFYENQSHLQS
ncbi:hypothetical protein TBLA_0E02050 [Henningerozyma blattae CBS 6284]|uniref:DNA ligase n=1 Tax=Henningerozyma blattae (strain ATCC 34711 / CBS 6284 / DSM 70876 / NBRC 10599 / NRRL Y-10934 / UCD 77-7) TaxID=1071380 RepID=I2H4F6_HENB6|nr:hypothetical protein TBLA_0E02050 [Tetrapisispora blattae CBS 6284]CCH61258.1 hypothetical protein TBLA_0E02050 [Tetrapisispora blattae CBS 6284]